MNELENKIDKINQSQQDAAKEQKRQEKKAKRQENINKVKTAAQEIIENIEKKYKQKIEEKEKKKELQLETQASYDNLMKEFEENKDKIGTAESKAVESEVYNYWQTKGKHREEITTVYTEYGPVIRTMTYDDFYKNPETPYITYEGFFPITNKDGVQKMEYMKFKYRHYDTEVYDDSTDIWHMSSGITKAIYEHSDILITTKKGNKFNLEEVVYEPRKYKTSDNYDLDYVEDDPLGKYHRYILARIYFDKCLENSKIIDNDQEQAE